MSSTQMAASQLSQRFGVPVSHLPQTDIFGIVIDQIPNAGGISGIAEQIGFKNNIHPVSAVVNGKNFLGFSVRPQAHEAVLAQHGISLKTVGDKAVAFDKPLYGGSWSCYGEECARQIPSSVDIRYRGLGGSKY